MTGTTRTWRQLAFGITMVGCIQFVVLTTVAMFFYPGGTHADHSTVGYSFWSNFFSDLGLITAHSGDANTVSFSLFVTALSLAALALVLFFAAVQHLFVESKIVRCLSILGLVVVIVSAISYIGIASTPWDIYPMLHQQFVYVAFTSFLLVVVSYSSAIFLNRDYPNVYAFTYLSFALILAVYLWLLFAGPEADTESGVRIQSTGQKVVVYAEIVCMFIQAYGALRMQKRISKAIA